MWACLFFVLLFRTAVLSSPPQPTNVTFTSVNLRNILQWSPGKDTPTNTKYNVIYAIYGELKEKRVQWRSVPHCTEITRTWCDLSEETSDLENGYYAKVRAVSRESNSKWVLTERFHPKHDIEFGPPHVSVEVDDKYVVVTIEGPMKYLPNNNTPQVPMATLYPLTYNLSIHNTQSGQIHHFILTGNQYKYRTMNHGTEMCFSARTQSHDIPYKHHSSAWHCVTTPEVPLIDRLERIVIISTAVPTVLLCLLAIGSYILYKYLLGTDQKSPVNLKMTSSFPPPLPIPPECVNIIVIQVSKDDVPIDKLYPKPNPSPASQRHEAPGLADVPGNLEDDYGIVICNADAGQCDVKNEGYNPKEWPIVAKPSGSTYASQNSFLQSLSSSVGPVLLNQSGENLQGLSLCANAETGSSDGNEWGNVVSFAAQPSNQFHDLPDDYGVVSCNGYASQNATSMQPVSQSDLLPHCYGLAGPAAAQEEEESRCLQIDWSPSTQRLVIPGFNLGTEHGEGGSPPTNRVHLDTVFVRQPSEEEALLGAEGGGSGQWGAEEFMAKFDLVISSD